MEISEMIVDKATRIVDSIKCGRPPKYDANKHLLMLILIFAKGKDIAAFCAAAEIHRDQFFAWRKQHAEFEEAYKHAKEHANLYYSNKEENGLNDPNFNIKLHSMIMRNRFRYSDYRPVEVKGIEYATTVKEKQMVIDRAIANGRLTGSEINYMTNYLNTCLKVEEIEVLSKRLDVLENLTCAKS